MVGAGVGGERRHHGQRGLDALLWREERPSRDAFLALASYTSIAGGDENKRLPLVFAKSVASAEEITEALGDQVRRAVELVLQSMSDTHLRALAQGEPSPLPEDPKAAYEGAVTVLMRIVLLLFAEERGLLPEHDLYRSSYAIARVREQLQQDATSTSLESLDHSWRRGTVCSPPATRSTAVHRSRTCGCRAYGGSLFDPARFPWLHATDPQGRLRVRLTDRAILAVLRAVQTIEDGAMQLSFRDLDVEQIGYVYEGLLGYSAAYVPDVTVGLHGKGGFEPEIALSELEEIADDASSPADFAKRLVDHLKGTQEQSKPRTPNQIAKAYGAADPVAAADARTRLRHALLGDDDLAARLEPFHGLIRTDLRGFPLRRTRRRVGDDGVTAAREHRHPLHAPLPRPKRSSCTRWSRSSTPRPAGHREPQRLELKSSAEILDLKIADIAAGSGAFLVAAARYLADRLIEARANEGLDVSGESDLNDGRCVRSSPAALRRRHQRHGRRDVQALALAHLDGPRQAVLLRRRPRLPRQLPPRRPHEEQLKAQHIYPERRHGGTSCSGSTSTKTSMTPPASAASSLPVRSTTPTGCGLTKAKHALLAQAEQVTARLRDVADGIIAAGLLEGGKPGKKLDDRYDDLADALRAPTPPDGTAPDRTELDAINDAGPHPHYRHRGDTMEASSLAPRGPRRRPRTQRF